MISVKKSPKKHLFYPRCKDILNETMQRTRKRPQNQEWCQEKLIRACHICFKIYMFQESHNWQINHWRKIQPRSNGSNQINLWQRTRHMQSADVRQLGIPGKIIGSCLIQLSKMIKIILKMFSYHIIIFVSILCLHEMVCVFKYSKIRLRNYCSSFFWIFS